MDITATELDDDVQESLTFTDEIASEFPALSDSEKLDYLVATVQHLESVVDSLLPLIEQAGPLLASAAPLLAGLGGSAPSSPMSRIAMSFLR